MKTLTNRDNPRRILMLVSYEPELHPHIKRIISQCAKLGRTDILGFVSDTDKPLREYDGIIYIERVNSLNYPAGTVFCIFLSCLYLLVHPRLFYQSCYRMSRRFVYRTLRHFSWGQNLLVFFREKEASWRHQNQSASISLAKQETHARALKSADSRFHALSTLYIQERISSALFARCRSSSLPPKVIICHDICTLKAAIKLKTLFGARVIYDRHQLTLEPDSPKSRLKGLVMNSREKKCIPQADLVITDAQSIGYAIKQLYED